MGHNNENKHAKLNYNNTSSLLMDLFLIKIAVKLKEWEEKSTLDLKVNKTEVQRQSTESLTYIACYSSSLFLPEFVFVNTEHAGNKSSK